MIARSGAALRTLSSCTFLIRWRNYPWDLKFPRVRSISEHFCSPSCAPSRSSRCSFSSEYQLATLFDDTVRRDYYLVAVVNIHVRGGNSYFVHLPRPWGILFGWKKSWRIWKDFDWYFGDFIDKIMLLGCSESNFVFSQQRTCIFSQPISHFSRIILYILIVYIARLVCEKVRLILLSSFWLVPFQIWKVKSCIFEMVLHLQFLDGSYIIKYLFIKNI